MPKERLADTLSFRITIKQRERLTRIADEMSLGTGEAARMFLDAGMKARGIK